MYAQFVAIVVFCFFVALWIAARVASVFRPAPEGISRGELVTTVLAGLTISIAALAVVVAGLAIWGYHAIRREARGIARTAARRSAIKFVNSPKMQEQLRTEARTIIADEFEQWTESQRLAISQPPQESVMLEKSEEKERVGRPIRRGKKEAEDHG